ncbi:hypothetical protein OEV98_06560 [Caldibacillus lycopersici]|uniref:Uncharacterized protein n=1 Tax=Perspicuibacillus lycopersici TaxID=1325689 RepID=A0AAE3LMW5_9BACI|nr:hypothetical protein [Perspicuibacillus lycopersici]MCU9613212.1 hypothetical protein [Perspicuibacillus lycopersici]
MLNTLSTIANNLNNKQITWALGGSLLLKFHQLVEAPNDIDILIEENHAHTINKILSTLGTTKEAIHTPPFRTKQFLKFQIQATSVDVMGGFAIEHQEGIFQLPFTEASIVEHRTINGIEIPLSALEDWWILYSLMPGKQEKANLLENHLRENGVKHKSILEKALKQSLPTELKNKVLSLLR